MSQQVADNQFGIFTRSFNLILEALRRRPSIETAYIFGSRALGTASPGSDIDIAVAGPQLDRATVEDLSVELNERLPIPYYVDVVAYDHLDHRGLKEHIDRHGVRFYQGD